MAFTFTDEHVTDYYTLGYTVFRRILPTSLIADLRRLSDAARPIARETRGPSAQRLQPLSAHGDRLDLGPLEAFAQLPELVDACRRVLTDEHVLQGADRTAMFFEPAELSYCTNWHRDITFESAAMSPEDWMRVNGDPTFFVQVNCALWNDCSTWYVPGSVNRRDLAAELAAAQAMPELDGQPEVERERRVLEYAAAMPGAVQLVLEPGDFALYQPNAWHIGVYSPYRRRATLHTSVWKPETIAWYQTWGARRKAAEAAAQSQASPSPTAASR